MDNNIEPAIGGCRVPSFSVVIPLYQKAHRVAACLRSVLAQRHQPLEIIVVDDGSTDGGGGVVAGFKADGLKYIRQDNHGVSAARNRGIEVASGDYIAFLDADDLWRDDHLEVMASLAVRYPRAILIGTSWTEYGERFSDPLMEDRETEIDIELFFDRGSQGYYVFATPAVCVRRADALPSPLFPIGSRIAEDQDAWISLLMHGRGVRSSVVTVDVVWDPKNPTMSAPRKEDLESVIFGKWTELAGRSHSAMRYVEWHRVMTIQRHVGYAPRSVLLRLLFGMNVRTHFALKLGVLLRMCLDAVGLLQFLRLRRKRAG